MKLWMKVLAVALAAVVGLVPVFGRISYAQALPPPSVVLPVGDELEEEDLLKTEGEFWYWIAAIAAAALTALAHIVHNAFFDGKPGFQNIRNMCRDVGLVYCTVFILGAGYHQ